MFEAILYGIILTCFVRVLGWGIGNRCTIKYQKGGDFKARVSVSVFFTYTQLVDIKRHSPPPYLMYISHDVLFKG